VNADPIYRCLLGYRAAAVLRAAMELDVFTAIAQGRRTAAAVARARGGTERSMRILLDATASSAPDLLRKRGAGYALTPASRRYLTSTSPDSLLELVPLYGHRTMWDAFHGLAAAVRAGTSVLESDAHAKDQEFWETFARATVRDGAARARRLRRLLGRLPGSAEVLDLACGSGSYGAEFAKAGARVTLFDQPNVLRVTRRLVEPPVRFLEGDLFRTPFGGPYDVIVASHVFHHFDPRECAVLARKCGAALKPGGRLAIQEFVPDEARSRRAQPLMFAATMLVWTRAGDAYRASEYRRWLSDAGLERFRHHALDLPGDFLVARKPTSSRA
jgi:SAM-dependent methyltransferase